MSGHAAGEPAAGSRARVVIIQKSLPHYRVGFFNGLRNRLAAAGFHLDLWYGNGEGPGAEKGDTASLDWAHAYRNRVLQVSGQSLLWQPVLRSALDADLVVVEQATKLLVNYALQTTYVVTGRPRFAFWGHGRNFQAQNSNSVAERVKRIAARHAHWWFAYNDLSAQIVRGLGFPAQRITSVQNSIDTLSLAGQREAITPADIAIARAELQIESDNVCVFSGGMYREKRLVFLLEACRNIRSRVPDFTIVFLGSGPDAHLVREAAVHDRWIRYLGPVFGPRKIAVFALSKLLLMPGLVGLAVCDAFALQTPLVTTAVTFHSPEIDYLTPDSGVLVREWADPIQYANAVVELLQSESRRQRLVKEGARLARVYTLETMIENFAEGIERALAVA